MTSLECLSKAGVFYLDVEYGNASHFYSGVKHRGSPHLGGGLRCPGAFKWGGSLIYTNVNLSDTLCLSGKCLERQLSFDICSESRIYDFVSRFVIYSDDARPGRINGKDYSHKSNNIYYQFPVGGEVSVPVSKSQRVRFESLGAEVPKGFNEVFYIRDEGRDDKGYRWIVHHRLIVDPFQVRLILRSCNPRFEGRLPLEQYLPHTLKRPFFRIRECRYPNFPFMAVGEACLSKGCRASISTAVELTCD